MYTAARHATIMAALGAVAGAAFAPKGEKASQARVQAVAWAAAELARLTAEDWMNFAEERKRLAKKNVKL